MAVEGDVVQRLSLAQRNPKHLDLVGEDQYRKHDHEFLQTDANDLDSFFPRKKAATMCIDFPRSIPQLDTNYSGAKQVVIPKEMPDPDAKK
ncbi:unnamed protein product [Camellia sinensis]